MAWRLAKSLSVLRSQVDAAVPGRSRSSDGTIGDTAHVSRTSDHNPNADGVVTALDITHDPKNGVDTYKLAEHLRQQRDRRIKYVISNGRIFSATTSPWTWRPYTGSNKHDKHIHVSVSTSRAIYDDEGQWDIAIGTADPGSPDVRPRLHAGSTGEPVRLLQGILGVPVTGIFDDPTDRAVRAFQEDNKLEADGWVGPYTWEALLRTQTSDWQTNITATVFGGSADANRSAYDNHLIADNELGVALPYRFKGERPRVEVVHGDLGVICQIMDVGPWNTDDPYWEDGRRPQAESGKDLRGRGTNLAGIDLTPRAAEMIGLPGKGLVKWRFIRDSTQAPTPLPPAGEGPDVVSGLVRYIEERYVVLTNEQFDALIQAIVRK